MRNVRSAQKLFQRFYTSGAAKKPASTGLSVDNVKGLSSNCVKPVSGPVGPGASSTGQYKVPEYFSFNRFSFAEAEIEMAKYRCPQPSALKK
ncbi:NADH:ubiquinone oxidoreductase subunit V3 [Cochliomyia hominivorax]